MKKLQSLFTNFRQRFFVAAWKRQRFLVADCICALATASVLLVVLTSCSHTRYIPMPEVHQRDSLSAVVHKKVNNTYIDRTHTLIQRGDTIFKTDSIYVEKYMDVEVHDTVVVNRRDSVPYPVEVPIEVEKPIPRFYKNCTAGFFLLLIAIIVFIALRLYLRKSP